MYVFWNIGLRLFKRMLRQVFVHILDEVTGVFVELRDWDLILFHELYKVSNKNCVVALRAFVRCRLIPRLGWGIRRLRTLLVKSLH